MQKIRYLAMTELFRLLNAIIAFSVVKILITCWRLLLITVNSLILAYASGISSKMDPI